MSRRLVCGSLIFFAGLAIAGGPTPIASAAGPTLRVLVDDVPLALTPSPIVQDAGVYLPLRPLARHFQARLALWMPQITITRRDGSARTIQLDRREVWSDQLVVSLLEAPVRLVNGVAMIPLGGVDALFDALTVWRPQDQVVVIVSHQAFQTATISKPLPPPIQAHSATTPSFVPEFQATTQGPLVASGYVTMGLALSGTSLAAATNLQYHSHSGLDYVDGGISFAVGPGAQTAGTVTFRNPAATLTVGDFLLDTSPLTLYQQGLLGGRYQWPIGQSAVSFFGGFLPNAGDAVLGATISFSPVGAWLFQSEALYDPTASVVVTRGRVDRQLLPWLDVFGEVAAGESATASGTAWRVGVETTVSASLTASLSYLSLNPGFPTIGNATLFASRSGPLLRFSWQPHPLWLVSTSVSVLNGAANGVSDRTTYDLLVGYRPTPNLAIAAGVQTIADTIGGVQTRTTGAELATVYTSGPWSLLLAANWNGGITATPATATGTSVFSLRAGYTSLNGLPLWVESTRYLGTTEGWGYGVGTGIHLGPTVDLTAQVREGFFTLPTPKTETGMELGVSRRLANGALVTISGGARYDSLGATTPYLSFQYGYPLLVRDVARVGRLVATIAVDQPEVGYAGGQGGVVLRIDGRTAAISDITGSLVVDGIEEGDHRVTLDEGTIPVGLVAMEEEQRVRVAADQAASLRFTLVPAATVHGVVYLDLNGNGQRDPDETGVVGVVLLLTPRSRMGTTDDLGAFEFANLPPGEYTVAVDVRSLPEGTHLAGDGIYTVVLRPGATVDLEIPVLGKPTIKTFGSVPDLARPSLGRYARA